MMLTIKRKIQRFRKVKLNYTFLLLFIFGLISAINLTLYWRVEQNFNQWFLELTLYGSILWHLYQKRYDLTLVSVFPANFIGCCLIIIPYLNANFSIQEISIFWYFLPLITSVGFALLASGFQGIKQFRRYLVITTIFPLVEILVKLLGMLIKITVISAKFTSFLLWYLGFDSNTQGTLVYVNNGIIDVLSECTAIPLLILLLKVSFLLIILFPSFLKNIYLPFILSVVISGVFSVIRLAIIALVVTDKPAFNYWHGSQGGDIFALLSFLLFGITILFLSPNHQIPSSLSKVTFHKSQPLSYSNLIIGISLIIILSNFSLHTSAGLSKATIYHFPQQIPLPGWQLTASEPVSVSQKQNKEIESDNKQEILSGQIYHYQSSGQSLTVNFYYIPSSLGDISSYYEQFSYLPDLPKLIKPLEKVNPKGHHLHFSSEENHYLTACINSMGKSTVTISQFTGYFYRPYLNPSQWLNLFNGKQTIRDRRCVWGQLSLAKGSGAELEAVWQALLSYWQDNFPKLKN
ncbi:cyanoexosortase A system-associated protein [Dolichospermum circinale]|uniref:cyanoexosortase A system-associated protein n=1 Tax=Dolichospermum circinale TaxID=109265 RepID=UPI00232BBC32|nr:cyanoexosortase A system-associated protein [Dolichospermum circinale]MDB9468576.1 cyanoexosortase A system-associated protein [Dolichospermum circinale CS-539/09]MDB9469447.1 cyanoexosortase A system-associated protein [Dolichospermum circinale CS-539]